MTTNLNKSNSSLAIAWGDWGKHPNALKGYEPTPGIGIRRRFSSYFKTFTINEYLTSQRCPCCKDTKCLKKHKDTNNIEKHHLLRCTNDHCKSRWWNRNVVGSFNILFGVQDIESIILNSRTWRGYMDKLEYLDPIG